MKLNRSDITALLALLVSLGALFVSIIEANIMRDQQRIMQSQQKASMFPYLAQRVKFELAETSAYIHTLENKGLGPAKVKTSSFRLNDEPIANYQELKEKLDALFPPETKYSISFFDPKSYFMTAKEKITILRVSSADPAIAATIVSGITFEVEFCYCSIFEDCWVHDGDERLDTCP